MKIIYEMNMSCVRMKMICQIAIIASKYPTNNPTIMLCY